MLDSRSTHVFVILIAVFALACSPHEPTGADLVAPELRLQAVLDEITAAHPELHGAALCVRAPGVRWQGAAGLADPTSGELMTAAHPVRIASNTKTFVAATTLRLVEEGRLDLDDPVARLISDEHRQILARDGYDLEAMTVRHLLNHSSGLYDHSDSERYAEAIISNPQHRWSRSEQLQAAVDWGEPWGAPGEVYHYADSGYILLGEIIERSSGVNLAQAVRELLRLESLGLDSVHFETPEDRPDRLPRRAHQFLGELDVTGFDPSFDLYGGGGIVCTMEDLARFTEALFTGDVFRAPATRDLMLSTSPGLRAATDGDSSQLPPGAYRMGLWEAEVDGLSSYRHTGFWGTIASWVPALELSVAATVNQHQAAAALLDVHDQAVAIVRSTSQGLAKE